MDQEKGDYIHSLNRDRQSMIQQNIQDIEEILQASGKTLMLSEASGRTHILDDDEFDPVSREVPVKLYMLSPLNGRCTCQLV